MTLQESSMTIASQTASSRPPWLLFVLTLQGQQPAVRMRVWRALKALGTAVLRDGVYLLPNRPEFIQPDYFSTPK
jgi:DNA-binding transcriptional regulator PaaX